MARERSSPMLLTSTITLWTEFLVGTAMRTSQRVSRYVRNLPVGAGEAVMLKNQRRHSTVPRSQWGFGHFDGCCK